MKGSFITEIFFVLEVMNMITDSQILSHIKERKMSNVN